ncbi:MAG: hypothetical protein M3P08_18050 [Thermoproteota archaeon]|jgi:hypothetical protein|nr:hypothetical protein [Thermoproteota archaeon]
MNLIQIYLDDETHATLVKNYTFAQAATEESFTFEEYLLDLLQSVSPYLPTHGVQPPEIKEKTIKVKQKILSFRGKEYLVQNSIVDLECNECARLFRCPRIYRQRIYKDGTSTGVGKHKIPEWHCPDHPNAIVSALETETLKDPDLK